MADIKELWMVVRTDAHGTAYLMKDGLDLPGAQAYLDGITGAQKKPHHQTYDLHPYAPEARAQRIRELGLLIP